MIELSDIESRYVSGGVITPKTQEEELVIIGSVYGALGGAFGVGFGAVDGVIGSVIGGIAGATIGVIVIPFILNGGIPKAVAAMYRAIGMI